MTTHEAISRLDVLTTRIKSEIPNTVDEVKGKLQEKIDAKEHLLRSIRCERLPDNGDRIRDQIAELQAMLDKIGSGDEVVLAAISTNDWKKKREEAKQTRFPSVSPKNAPKIVPAPVIDSLEEKDVEEMSSLLDSLTKRFSELDVGENPSKLYQPSPIADKLYRQLFSCEKDENGNYIEAPSTQLISTEEVTELNNKEIQRRLQRSLRLAE